MFVQREYVSWRELEAKVRSRKRSGRRGGRNRSQIQAKEVRYRVKREREEKVAKRERDS